MTKIKIVHLNVLYNFVIENVFIWINLLFQNIIWKLPLPGVTKTLDKEAICPA
jgi:hypothetical protein